MGRVTFASDLEVEIPIFGAKAPPGQLPPPRSRSSSYAEAPTSAHAEDAARANLQRLVANQRKVAKRWSFLEDVATSCGGFFARAAERHATLRGDLLLLGR